MLLLVEPGACRVLCVALRVNCVLLGAPGVSLMAPVAPGVRLMAPVALGVRLMLLVASGVCFVCLHRASAPAAGVTGVRLAGAAPPAGASVRKTAR